MRYILLLLLFLTSVIAFGDIYMSTDKKGNVTYSDTPLSGSTQITTQSLNELTSTVKALPTQPAQTSATSSSGISTENTSGTNYEKFFIDSPLDQQTITNQPVIPVEIGIKPDLRPDDAIELFLDGKPSGAPSKSPHLQIDHPDRGTHQLYAVVFDKNLNILQQTQVITIFVHYAALGG